MFEDNIFEQWLETKTKEIVIKRWATAKLFQAMK